MSTPPLGEVRQLASALQGLSTDTSNYVVQRKGEIVSVEAGTPDTCTIMLSGDTTEIPGVHFMSSYVPVVGDIVIINKQGGSLLIQGTLGDATQQPTLDWEDWTPTWSGLSVLGSCVSQGRVWKQGRRVEMVALLNWGTGSSLGTGSITVSLPYTAASYSNTFGWQGMGKFRESTSGLWHPMHCNIEQNGTVCSVNAIRPSDTGLVSPGSQSYTWGGSTGLIRAQISYESAS